ncbi:hypothetical protein GY45DRAFT_697930 [Cubamyces sp. BRFM 1775]|nr:hypothetical protein GY45DRAFT_697930 [Cubamyces sp. BRFM 1775]
MSTYNSIYAIPTASQCCMGSTNARRYFLANARDQNASLPPFAGYDPSIFDPYAPQLQLETLESQDILVQGPGPEDTTATATMHPSYPSSVPFDLATYHYAAPAVDGFRASLEAAERSSSRDQFRADTHWVHVENPRPYGFNQTVSACTGELAGSTGEFLSPGHDISCMSELSDSRPQPFPAPARRQVDKVPTATLATDTDVLDDHLPQRPITAGSVELPDLTASSSSAASTVSTPSPRVRPFNTSVAPISQPRRNTQVPLDVFRGKMAKHTGWSCPFCDYKQDKKRRPDLRRHIYTHCPDADYHNSSDPSSASQGIRKRWCCGVPVHLAAEYGIHPPFTGKEFKIVIVDGVEHVGGCDGKLSRADALRRHIEHASSKCVSTMFSRDGANAVVAKAPRARKTRGGPANSGKKVRSQV